jgi:hypothetical protein
LAISLFQRGLAGNVAAAREAMKIMEKVEAQQKAAKEDKPVTYVFKLAGHEDEDCDTAFQKLGATELYLGRWRICTWVVEAALARNNQLLLEETDREIVANNMLDPSVLETILPKAA